MGTPAPNLAILSLVAARDKSKVSSTDPWLLLVDIAYAGEHLRLARCTDEVQFDAGDGAGIQTYKPLAFEINYERQISGKLPSAQLTVSNVQRIAQTQLEQFQGLVGATVSLYALNLAHGLNEPDLAVEFEVKQAGSNARWVTLTLGNPSPIRLRFPRFVYRADFCMWQYKGLQCGYVGAMPSCSLTLNGANGCASHNNSPRFGGFPGIGTNGGLIASQI